MKSLDNNSYGDLINQNLDQKEMISPNEKSKSGYSLYTKKKVQMLHPSKNHLPITTTKIIILIQILTIIPFNAY